MKGISMLSKFQINYKGGQMFGKRSGRYDRVSMNLREEYEDRLRAGEDVTIQEFVDRYPGPDKDDFRIELNLAAMLVAVSKKQYTHAGKE